jgi:selenocysteine lyase/cysteine desulfurase
VAHTLKSLSANPGRSGHALSLAAAELVYRARGQIADFFGCADADRVIFTSGCTAALNLGLFGTAQKGHIIATADAHNAVLRPLFELERRGGVRLTILPPSAHAGVPPEAVAAAMQPDTYLVALSHVGNVNGIRTELQGMGAFCAYKNALLLVDAAQSAGHIEINMEKAGIDLLAVAPHKGLHGPQGIGALLCGARVKNLRPTVFGGTGGMSESRTQPALFPEGYEAGTLNTPGIAGFAAGVAYTRAHFSEFAGRLSALTKYLHKGLQRIKNVRLYAPPSPACGVVSFVIDGITPQETADILSGEYDVAVRAGLHCAPLMHKYLGTAATGGTVRASLSPLNRHEEIDFFLAAVDELADRAPERV